MAKNNNPEIVIPNNKNSGKMYTFPSDIYDLVNNRMTMTIHEYKRGNPMTPGNLSESLATIVLPLPEGLRDDVNLRFTEDSSEFIGGVASLSGDPVTAAGQLASGFSSRLLSKVGSAVATIGDARTGDSFVGDAVRLAGRGFNYAQNPNLALTFEGVSLREHSFSWELVAKSREESQTLKSIMNILKRAALPRKYSGANFTFAYPYVFRFSFQPTELIKISKLGCVCEGISINPASSGTYAFFEGTNDPAVINLSMKFRERAVLTAEDYGAESVSILKGSTGKL